MSPCKDVRDGATILMGGFGLCGIPENLIAALLRAGTKNLTVVSNNRRQSTISASVCSLQTRQIRKMIASYVRRESRCSSNRCCAAKSKWS